MAARVGCVFLMCGILSAERTLGQAELQVLETRIESKTNEALDRRKIEFLDGSHWDLNPIELARAEALQENFRQYISDRRISPLEILGIHAQTDAERNRYARRWATLMIEDAQRVLAFQRAYDDEVRSLLDDQPLIDLTQLSARSSSISALLPSDRLALFVRVDCTVCDEVSERVFRAGLRLEGVDVYVLGLIDGSKAALHAWANRRGIPPMAVHAKRITLNFDNGLLARVHPRANEVPVVMRRRGNEFEPLDPWELL